MSDDRDVRANLGVTSDSAEMKEIAEDVRDITESLLDAGDAAKQTTLDFQRVRPEDINFGGAAIGSAGGGGGASGRTGGSGLGKARAGLASLSRASSLLGGEAGEASQQVIGLASQSTGLATQFSSLVAGMGPLGLAAGAATAAIGVLATKALFDFNKAAEETATAINTIKDIQIAYNESLDMTSDSINEQIEANEKLLETNLANQEATQDAIDALDEPTDIFFKIGDGLGLVGAAGDELDDELKALEATEHDLTTSTEGLTEALQSEEVAANDAAAALIEHEEKLARMAEAAAAELDGLARAGENLAREAKASAKAAQDATKKLASARTKEREARQEIVKAQNDARDDELKLEAEQEEDLAKLRADAHKDEMDAREDFGDDIGDLLDNQSFLAAIDEQDDFVKSEKKRKAAAKESLIALQLELAEERIIEDIAAQELLADKHAAIAKESALVREAERDEIKLKREATQDVLELQRNRAEQEVKLQEQLNENFVTMLSRVVEFSGDAVNEVNRRLASIDTSGGKKGKRAGRTRAQAMHDMINEVIRPT